MIWLRRSLVIPLGILLFLTLFALVALIQANSTLLRSAYYAKVLNDADFYNFLLNDVVSTAVDETLEVDGELLPGVIDGNPLNALELSNEQLTSSINSAFPPDWVQANAELVILDLGGYVTGENDEFEFSINPVERSETVTAEMKTLVGESSLYELTFEGILAPAVADTVVTALPVELQIGQSDVEQYIRNVFPEEWAEPQIEVAIEELAPYLMGNNDSFKILLPMDDRIVVALQELKLLLGEAEAYEMLYGALVNPIVANSFGGQINLPYGVTLNEDEIVVALREVAPPSWIQAQAERIIDDATPYLTGEVDSFSTDISLTENKLAAVDVVEITAGRKLQEHLSALPTCTNNSSLPQVIAEGFQSPIDCVPSDTPIDVVAAALGNGIANSVEASIMNSVPDVVSFTEVDLQETLFQAGIEDPVGVLNSLRSNAQNGWAFDDQDLENTIRGLFLDEMEGEDAVETLDDVRGFLGDGWTYSHTEFREDLTSEQTLNSLDSSRNNFKRFRFLGPFLVIPILILSAAIGYLGGEDWRTRIIWGIGSLVTASALVLLLMLLLYGTIVEPRLDTLRVGIITSLVNDGSFVETKRLAANKVFEILGLAADDFASGVIAKTSTILVIGIFALVIAVAWDLISPYLARIEYQRYLPRRR